MCLHGSQTLKFRVFTLDLYTLRTHNILRHSKVRLVYKGVCPVYSNDSKIMKLPLGTKLELEHKSRVKMNT